MTTALDTVLDMNCAEDRDRIRTAITERGIIAYDSDLGGGLRVLEIVLVPDNGREALSIVAASLDAPCEVGLSGFRTAGDQMVDCASAELLRPVTVAQAVAAIEAFWTGQDAFMRDFRSGAYDLP